MSESLSDAVRDRARADMEAWLARVNTVGADLTMYDLGMIAGAGVGAQEVAGRLPSEAELTNAILGRTATSAAKAVLASIREHVTRG